MGLPIGMTLYFLDRAKTSAERPYPRVVRVEGEPGRAESMTLARAEKRLEHDLAAALQEQNASGKKHLSLPTRGERSREEENTTGAGNSGRAISLLCVLRGPDAGKSFPILRGDTTLGRSPRGRRGKAGHVHLRDPFLRGVHGTFRADSSGVLWRPVNTPARKIRRTRDDGARPVVWDEPFLLGSSLCVLRDPGVSGPIPSNRVASSVSKGGADKFQGSLADSPDGNPFEPVTVNPAQPRKLKQILLSVCLPILVGLAIALLTGLWFLLLMSAASSLLMLLHFFGSRAENRAGRAMTRTAAEREEQRALNLPTAADLAFAATSPALLAFPAHPGIVLGCGPRLPYLRGRNLTLASLPRLQRAPHYVPLPAGALGHLLSLDEGHLRAYLVQLVAGYPGSISILLGPPASAEQERINALLQTLAVVPRVSVYSQRSETAPEERQALHDALHDELSAQTPPLLIMSEDACDIYAPLVRTLQAEAASVEATTRNGSRAPKEPRGASVALCIVADPKDGTRSSSGRTVCESLFAAGWLECVSEGSHCHSIRYAARHYSKPPEQPSEGVVQVHPLLLDDLCLHADGLSVKAFIRALDHLYLVEEGPRTGKISDAQVHQFAHRFSSLSEGKNERGEGGVDLSAEGLKERWSKGLYAEDIRCYLGVSQACSLSLGLSEHGPHWLLGGTTGAGKSQLLRSLVLSAALAYPPERLGLILVDFKGSAGLGPLAELPHTLSILSNFDVSAVERALEFLRADVHRRETNLQAAGVNSYRDYLAGCRAQGVLPRYPELLIVVDEFRMLIDSMPDAMTELMRIATIGRSLGLHLILATQRPQGTISQDIRANIATSICLRVASAQDSYNLLEHEAAAYISAAQPGAGYVRLPDGRSLSFRAPLTDRVPSEVQAIPPKVFSLEPEGWRCINVTEESPREGYGEDECLTRSIRETFRAVAGSHGASYLYGAPGTEPRKGEQEEYCPIPEELPESLSLSLPAEETERGNGYLLGELEIARYGVRGRYRWNGGQTLGLLAQSAERIPFLLGLLAQAISAKVPVVLLTSDGSLQRDLEPYAPFLEVLVGPQEHQHLRFCLEELREQRLHAESEGHRPLIIVDGLDGWLDALIRHPDTEHLLYDILSQGYRRGYSVLFTSALSPRGRFGTVAHSTLLSRRFLDTDLMRSTSRDYPVPSQGHYCVEGSINEGFIGDQPLTASVLAPCALSLRDFEMYTCSSASASAQTGTLLRQFPEYFRMPAEEYIRVAQKTCNPRGEQLLVGFNRRRLPGWLSAGRGSIIPVPGARSTGKSTLLESVRQLNPHLEALWIKGGNSSRPFTEEMVRSLLSDVKHPAQTLLLVDDLQYLSAGVQNVLLERRGAFHAVFVTYTPWPRRASSPLLSTLMGCSRAILLAPATLAEADICTVTALPADRFTRGEQPAGRAIAVDGSSVEAIQVPLPRVLDAHPIA